MLSFVPGLNLRVIIPALRKRRKALDCCDNEQMVVDVLLETSESIEHEFGLASLLVLVLISKVLTKPLPLFVVIEPPGPFIISILVDVLGLQLVTDLLAISRR